MTREEKQFIELSDLLALHFVCKHCGASVSRPLSAFHQTPINCGNCDQDWLDIDDARSRETIGELVNIIRKIKAITNRRGFHLRIELQPEEDNKSATPSASQKSEPEP